MKILSLLTFSFVMGLFIDKAYSAACCGGNANLPSLITTPSFAQVSLAQSYSKVIAEAKDSGAAIMRDRSHDEYALNSLLTISSMTSQYWQLGLQIPFSERNYQNQSFREQNRGLGDMSLQVAYEFMPERYYSRYKPRAFVFSKFSVPTGKNMYEVLNQSPSTTMGTGFYQLSLGTALIKQWKVFDAFSSIEIHQGFKNDFKQNDQNFSVTPGIGASATLALGYSPLQTNWRFGLDASYLFQDDKRIEGIAVSRAERIKELWALGLSAGYLLSSELSMVANIQDQSILGPARNTLVNRSVAISLIKRWNR